LNPAIGDASTSTSVVLRVGIAACTPGSVLEVANGAWAINLNNGARLQAIFVAADPVHDYGNGTFDYAASFSTSVPPHRLATNASAAALDVRVFRNNKAVNFMPKAFSYYSSFFLTGASLTAMTTSGPAAIVVSVAGIDLPSSKHAVMMVRAEYSALFVRDFALTNVVIADNIATGVMLPGIAHSFMELRQTMVAVRVLLSPNGQHFSSVLFTEFRDLEVELVPAATVPVGDDTLSSTSTESGQLLFVLPALPLVLALCLSTGLWLYYSCRSAVVSPGDAVAVYSERHTVQNPVSSKARIDTLIYT